MSRTVINSFILNNNSVVTANNQKIEDDNIGIYYDAQQDMSIFLLSLVWALNLNVEASLILRLL